jgi:hypothetical protein
MIGMGADWGGLASWPEVPYRKAEIAEWQYTTARAALVLGQDPQDFSTRDAVKNFNKWKFDITNDLEANGWEVRYREHPRVLMYAPIEVQRPPHLAEDLRDVGLVVGLNTGALVESSILGWPVHAVDAHSLVYPLSAKLSDKSGNEPEGRQALFDGLAGQSWTYAECSAGTAWEAVREHVLGQSEVEAGEPPAEVPAKTRRPRTSRKA